MTVRSSRAARGVLAAAALLVITVVAAPGATAALSVGGAGARTTEEPRQPVPELAALEPVAGRPCTPESQYDMPDHYGSRCERLRFVFGPITVKPGQNDLMIEPTTYQKPLYDGYMTRFKPDLIDHTGIAPPVEELHLHHGTWLTAPTGRSYGSGPWMASGEEKTIAFQPHRYGLKMLKDDKWLFLYMVHNALATPREVWVTYDVDFVKLEDGDAIQPDGRPLLTGTKSIWLDVGGGSFHPETETYPFNPIYNSQRGFGAPSVDYAGQRVCSWPKENCARFNSLGNVSAQQGMPFGTIAGKDFVVPSSLEGSIVVMGGHLHPGGLRDEISLVRDGVEKPIHFSDAIYWDHEDPTRPGGSPTSWDFSMTGTSTDLGWKIRVKAGDILRLNAVYDADVASWYENMGIVMLWVAPGDDTGVDVFDPNVTITPGYPTQAVLPPGLTATCTNSATNICLGGQVTHGQYAENSHHGRCTVTFSCPPLTAMGKKGPLVDRIDVGGFTYGVADFGVIGVTGIPQVKVGEPVTFTNLDTADYMWHTITRCQEPCTGSTTVDYPIADGGNGLATDEMDFDSTQLGVGLYPAQKVQWSLTPDRPGTFTFFCRVHPSMRGAVEAVE